MIISDIVTVLIQMRWVILTIALLAGAGYEFAPKILHKSAPQKTAHTAVTQTKALVATNALPDNPNDLTLGEVMLTNHCETCVELSGGKNCTLLARGDGRNVELTVALKSFSPDGQTHDLSVTQVNAKSGKPVEIALGDYELSFTPRIEN
jgi:hypothetical protein